MEETSVYRITVEEIAGRTRACLSGTTVADSRRAKRMLETYRSPALYFPKSDVPEEVLEPAAFRTFCPFKGTAEYWNVRLPGSIVENGAWSYERPLEEAKDVEGYIAFSPHPDLSLEIEPAPAAVERELLGGNALMDWLLIGAWRCTTPAELTEQYAQQVTALGVPLWRLDVNLWTLHPELAGKRFTWSRDGGGVTESDTPHGLLNTQAYIESPVRHVCDGLGGVRQRLDAEDPEFRFPILEQLRADGGTDYVAMPLHFSDGRIHSMTMATDHADGFATPHLGQVFGSVFALARFYEVMTLRNNAVNLFDAYLGSHTGRQVLGGLTRRGDGENIRAAILFCDLRDSTALTEALSREIYLGLLNDFFERAAGPVLESGGEVLKFIGDAVLAIFPVARERGAGDGVVEGDSERTACRKALDAAHEIVRRVASMTPRPGVPAVQCGIGLHFGDVTYGNVGAPGRLDFTVIGSAANVAARLSGACKNLEHGLVVSGEVASKVPEGLRSLGKHPLRNVGSEIEIFVPAGAAFG